MVFFLLLIVLPAGFAGCGHRGGQSPSKDDKSAKEADAEEGPAVSVHVVEAQRKVISESVYALGTCEVPIGKSAAVTPAVEGQVSEILVKYGEKVKAGQPLVRLNPKLAEANLQEKIAAVAGLKVSLKLLQTLPRPEEQKSYQLAIDDAKVTLQKAQAAVERLRPLRDRGDVPKQQLFEAELAAEQARLASEKAESQYKAAMLGPRREAVEEAQSHIETAEAAAAVIQRQLDLHTLCSPIDGVIDRINCQLGQTLAVGTLIAEVVDVKQVEVLAWLPAFEAARVHVGQTAAVKSGGVDKNSDSPGKTIFGKVTFVGGVVDPQTGSLPVRVLIENPEDCFALGQTVTLMIAVREKPNALVVPAVALDDLGDGLRLNVVREGKTAILHPRLGLKSKEWVGIEQTDLKAGELVIVEGGYNLPAGTKVKTIPQPSIPDSLSEEEKSSHAEKNGEATSAPSAARAER